MDENLTFDELQDHFIEAVEAIIDDCDIQESRFYKQDPEHLYNHNVSTDDQGWFLILGGWDEANIISEELLKRYPCIEEETGIDTVDYGNVLDTLYCWHYGFADEYGVCDNCQSPINLEDGDYINDYDACERTCFDCIDDEYYFDWLTNHPDRANTKYTRGELEERGWICISDNLRSTMHNMPSDNPEQMLEDSLEIEPDGQFIFSVTHSDPFTVEFEMYKRPTSWMA